VIPLAAAVPWVVRTGALALPTVVGFGLRAARGSGRALPQAGGEVFKKVSKLKVKRKTPAELVSAAGKGAGPGSPMALAYQKAASKAAASKAATIAAAKKAAGITGTGLAFYGLGEFLADDPRVDSPGTYYIDADGNPIAPVEEVGDTPAMGIVPYSSGYVPTVSGVGPEPVISKPMSKAEMKLQLKMYRLYIKGQQDLALIDATRDVVQHPVFSLVAAGLALDGAAKVGVLSSPTKNTVLGVVASHEVAKTLAATIATIKR